MPPEGIKQAVLLALTQTALDLGRIKEELHNLVDQVTGNTTATVAAPAAPPAEALGLFIFAVERLFKEASDWTKSCTSTSNWFDHNPAAQALKALLGQYKRTAAQEPAAQAFKALLEQYKRPAAQEPLVQQTQAQESQP
jgi:hypothetical protein